MADDPTTKWYGPPGTFRRGTSLIVDPELPKGRATALQPPKPPGMAPGETVSMTPGPDPREKVNVAGAKTAAGPEIDLSEVIDDPYFKALGLPEKQKVMLQDPHYRTKMSPQEQQKMLDLVHYGGSKTEEYQKGQKAQADYQRQTARQISYAIPVTTGLAGAIVGAPAGPGGSVVGGGLGAAAGESLRETAMHAAFPEEEPSPVSREGLKETLTAGAVGAASELPAAFAQGYGQVALRRLAAAKSPKEVGDVVDAFNDVHPFAVTKAGLREGLEGAKRDLSKQIAPILRASQGTSDIDQVLAPIRARAAQEDAAFARGGKQSKRVSNAVADVIAAAKSRAGIKGSTATAAQLMNFQNEVKNLAFESARANPTVGGVAQNIMRDGYRAVGQELDRVAPPARPILDKMTDIHAALDGLRRSAVGTLRATAITAATHPRTAAAVSPVVPATATETWRAGRRILAGVK